MTSLCVGLYVGRNHYRRPQTATETAIAPSPLENMFTQLHFTGPAGTRVPGVVIIVDVAIVRAGLRVNVKKQVDTHSSY